MKTLSRVLTILATGLLAVSVQGQTSESSPVSTRAALSHTALTASFPETIALKIDLAAVRGVSSGERSPLNLALVIDRSGSMGEQGKMEYAMRAARLLVENLSDQDIVSVIAFSEGATVLSPAGLAVNKQFLNHRLSEVVPDGPTNLSAGLLEAFAQIDSKASEDQIKRVIVLTDGVANRGVTSRTKLGRIVETAREKGIGISTLGCGEKFDEKMLIQLAEVGGGRYTYIRSPEQIPEAMAQELGGLLDVVAQNVTVEVKAVAGLEITGIDGWIMDQPRTSFTFDLGDLREGDHGILLLELARKDFSLGQTAQIETTFTLDPTDTGQRVQRVVSLEATMTNDQAQATASANQSVVYYAEIIDAVTKAEDAILGLDDKRYQESATRFEQMYDRVRQFAIETRDQQLLNQMFIFKHLMTELAETGAAVHGHDDAREQLKREVEYQRYLRTHHRPRREKQ
jgi:Ca-activated chloride channel homolog